MAQQGGLGRGLSSLIPRRKNKKASITNYFGSEIDLPGEENVEDASISDSEKVVSGEATGKSQEVSSKQIEANANNARITDVALKSIIEAPVDSIEPNPHQPRAHFDEHKLQELADSIKEHGVLQPLVVSRKENGKYELIAGERRLEAGKIAGLSKIPVVVRKATEQNKAELALVENIQRHDLNVMEEAKAYKKMQDSFAMTQEEIALRMGKSRSKVANIVRLLNLPLEVQQAVSEGKITEGHARTILALSGSEKQRALFELIIREKLNVRQAEDRVREITMKTNPRRLHSVDPEMRQKEQSLSELLGTKVKIRKGKNGGQITIEFYSDEEFSSLHKKLSAIL